MLEPNQLQATVSAYFAATRSLDLEAWLNTFAEDAVSYEPAYPPLEGHAALTQYFQGITNAFEQVGLTEEFVAIVNNEAAVKWVGTGVGKNGRAVTFAGIDVFEMNEAGKIQTLWAYWNPAALIAELSA